MEKEKPWLHAYNNKSIVLRPRCPVARFRDFISGATREKCPPTGSLFWVDLRDVALAHALAVEKPNAAGKRYFLTAGNFCNRELVKEIGDSFPELKDRLPSGEEALKDGFYPPGDPPGGPKHGFDNSASRNDLGLEYRSLKDSVIDTVKSIQAIQNAAL